MDASRDETRIRRYLLGDLAEPEQERFEDEFFDDDDLFEEVRAVEDELIDEYVRGELSDQARQQFEFFVQRSPGRRQRVDLARALQETAFHASRAPRLARAAWRESILALLGFGSPRLRLALSIASLLVVAAGAFWLWSGSRNQPVPEFRAQQPSPQLPGAAGPPPPESRSVGSGVLSVSLTPGLLRSVEGGRSVDIPPGITTLRFHLEIDPSLSHSRYQVRVETAEGTEVWKQDGLEPSAVGSSPDRTVTFEAPVRVFSGGDYILFLRTTKGGRTHDVAEYFFSHRLRR